MEPQSAAPGVPFGARSALRAQGCARQRCAACIARYDIANATVGPGLQRGFPAREDGAVFVDRNYVENSIEPRKLGISCDRRRITRRPNPPPGARPSKPSILAPAPDEMTFSLSDDAAAPANAQGLHGEWNRHRQDGSRQRLICPVWTESHLVRALHIKVSNASHGASSELYD